MSWSDFRLLFISFSCREYQIPLYNHKEKRPPLPTSLLPIEYPNYSPATVCRSTVLFPNAPKGNYPVCTNEGSTVDASTSKSYRDFGRQGLLLEIAMMKTNCSNGARGGGLNIDYVLEARLRVAEENKGSGWPSEAFYPLTFVPLLTSAESQPRNVAAVVVNNIELRHDIMSKRVIPIDQDHGILRGHRLSLICVSQLHRERKGQLRSLQLSRWSWRRR